MKNATYFSNGILIKDNESAQIGFYVFEFAAYYIPNEYAVEHDDSFQPMIIRVKCDELNFDSGWKRSYGVGTAQNAAKEVINSFNLNI